MAPDVHNTSKVFITPSSVTDVKNVLDKILKRGAPAAEDAKSMRVVATRVETQPDGTVLVEVDYSICT